MPEISLSSGEAFKAEVGMSILDAAHRALVQMPYSCKTGRCSSCKSKVVSGSATALHPETGLTDQEKADGWILSCVRTADTDLVLESEDLGGHILPFSKTLPCRISQMMYLAPDVMQVFLRLPPSSDFKFIPGQYVDVIGPNGIRRSYSLANASGSDKVLELHIRAVENGTMSQYWFQQAKPNDLLRLNGPLGTFFLRNITGVDLFFLATGTGIAPVKAILESLAALPPEQLPKSVTVLWGGRTPQDLYFDIKGIPGKHRYIPVLSRPGVEWAGSTGYVQNVLLKLNPDLANAVVYACGSDSMIQSAKSCLLKAGLQPKHFYSDAFVCSAVN